MAALTQSPGKRFAVITLRKRCVDIDASQAAPGRAFGSEFDLYRAPDNSGLQEGFAQPQMDLRITDVGLVFWPFLVRDLHGEVQGTFEMFGSAAQGLVVGEAGFDAEDGRWIGDELFHGVSLMVSGVDPRTLLHDWRRLYAGSRPAMRETGAPEGAHTYSRHNWLLVVSHEGRTANPVVDLATTRGD